MMICDYSVRGGSMTLKKINTGFSLLAILLLVVHAIYELIAYIVFIYNPGLTLIFALSATVAMVIHGILAAVCHFGFHDSKKIQYKKLNIRTLIQRITAVSTAVLLPLHAFTFPLLGKMKGTWIINVLLLAGVVFYISVFTHIAVSFSNALITFGLLGDMKKRKVIDIIVWIMCALLCAAVSVVITMTEYAMFMSA